MNPDPHHTGDSSDELSARSFAGAGIQFAASIIIFLFLGRWIDAQLGTSPLFLLGGVFVGGGAAFYAMYRRLVAAQKKDDERRARKHAQ